MSQEGFLFGELSEFKQDLMRSIKNDFPKETENFIKNDRLRELYADFSTDEFKHSRIIEEIIAGLMC